MNYSINIGIFVKNFLPTRKRTAKHVSWLNALLRPMQWLNTNFFGNYTDGFSGYKILNYDASETFNAGELVYYNGIIYECILASTGNLPTDITYFTVRQFEFGDLIQNSENSVYYALVDNTDGIAPVNTDYWMLMQPNFLGLNERIKANSQILVFEYILNKWFGTGFNYPASTNDVYITNSATDINTFLIGYNNSTSSAVTFNSNTQEAFVSADYSVAEYNYTINIPLATYDSLKPTDASGTTTTKDAIVSNFVDKYNLAGLTYTINPY